MLKHYDEFKSPFLRFGELVSTSNSFSSETKEVIVETDSMLLWTMDLPEGLLGKKK